MAFTISTIGSNVLNSSVLDTTNRIETFPKTAVLEPQQKQSSLFSQLALICFKKDTQEKQVQTTETYQAVEKIKADLISNLTLGTYSKVSKYLAQEVTNLEKEVNSILCSPEEFKISPAKFMPAVEALSRLVKFGQELKSNARIWKEKIVEDMNHTNPLAIEQLSQLGLSRPLLKVLRSELMNITTQTGQALWEKLRSELQESMNTCLNLLMSLQNMVNPPSKDTI